MTDAFSPAGCRARFRHSGERRNPVESSFRRTPEFSPSHSWTPASAGVTRGDRHVRGLAVIGVPDAAFFEAAL
jgi:hypothetical protein